MQIWDRRLKSVLPLKSYQLSWPSHTMKDIRSSILISFSYHQLPAEQGASKMRQGPEIWWKLPIYSVCMNRSFVGKTRTERTEVCWTVPHPFPSAHYSPTFIGNRNGTFFKSKQRKERGHAEGKKMEWKEKKAARKILTFVTLWHGLKVPFCLCTLLHAIISNITKIQPLPWECKNKQILQETGEPDLLSEV